MKKRQKRCVLFLICLFCVGCKNANPIEKDIQLDLPQTLNQPLSEVSDRLELSNQDLQTTTLPEVIIDQSNKQTVSGRVKDPSEIEEFRSFTATKDENSQWILTVEGSGVINCERIGTDIFSEQSIAECYQQATQGLSR